MGQLPTHVNGMPYTEWVKHTQARTVPDTAKIETPPVKVEQPKVDPKIEQLIDDLETIKIALDLDTDVHLIDVLNRINELRTANGLDEVDV